MANNEDSYFKSKGAKYVFALLYLDGQCRCNILGITEDLYGNNKKAKRWHRRIERAILYNALYLENYEDALNKLEKMYFRMLDC